MSNYTKATNFTAKDSLSTGDPGKLIKGSEIDAEYSAIATAITSKADTASPTFTGTPSAPTAASGTSSAQIATTAFVQAALQATYPVGSIYMSAVSTNPGTTFGFGTWAAFGAGRVPVGYDAANANFNASEKTGGSEDAIVVSHTHTASSTDSGHTHTYNQPTSKLPQSGSDTQCYVSAGSTNTGTGYANITTTITAAGESGTNKNYQPYITVYMWKRTA